MKKPDNPLKYVNMVISIFAMIKKLSREQKMSFSKKNLAES